jgi:hypothetical protein
MDEDIIGSDDTFAALLRSAEDGNLINVLGAQTRDAIKRLRKHADKNNRRANGTLTIKIKMGVDAKGFMETEGDIAVKLPKSTRPTSVHWTDEEGDILNRRPERQLELKAVAPTGSTEPAPSNVKDIKGPAVKAM